MIKKRWSGHLLAGLGLMLAALAGCQTYVPATGQTLPSPRYLDHPPQYFPPSPPFPLPRELGSIERANAAARAGMQAGAAEGLPPRVPAGPMNGPENLPPTGGVAPLPAP